MCKSFLDIAAGSVSFSVFGAKERPQRFHREAFMRV